MAEYTSVQEARNYELSNGTKVDLVALIDVDAPADWITPDGLGDLHVGQVAYVSAMGRMRRGVVSKIGRTKVTVTFTTQGSVDEVSTLGRKVRLQSTAADASSVRVAPAPTADEVIERTIERQTAPAEVVEAPAAKLVETTATVREDENGKVHYIPAKDAPATGSTVVEALERVWDVIRENHQELPAVVIVTGTGFIGTPRWGHFRANGWTHREHEVQAEGVSTNLRLGEMFVAGETLAKGATHTVETMLHEAVHVLAKVREIQDTSRQNRWHNAKFRTLAGELGMEYEGAQAHPKIGFSEVVLTPGTREDYAPVIDALDAAIRLTVDLPAWLGGATGQDGAEGASSGGEYISGGKAAKGDTEAKSSNYVKAVCGCRDGKGKPEFVIRIAKTKLERAEIRCGICDELFGAPEDDES